jgi:hypothetical protein
MNSFSKNDMSHAFAWKKINSKLLKFYFLPLSGLVVDDDNL